MRRDLGSTLSAHRNERLYSRTALLAVSEAIRLERGPTGDLGVYAFASFLSFDDFLTLRPFRPVFLSGSLTLYLLLIGHFSPMS